ncbi:Anthranilate 1,2-dioxygenase large subunit [Planctomycetes bacterium Pan216]|uniref:Anthranilate 1,2-dioxygenase large subunit n=1 Tax=Kolteria novifilia TaxID=2527975 RepID=A0A518B9Q6_9BACT|nr:Anthranilate 1,2-dioxygenase large subunit [Planctomycetes bacterium Pan216]
MTESLRDLIEAFEPDRPLEQAETIPDCWYRDPALASFESEKLLRNSWQLVAAADQVARAGQFVTADIDGEPILVVRDERDSLRALANVCRHRASPVAIGAGTTDRLRCPYHGWTYDLSGRLRGTPEFDGVEDFDRSCQGLAPWSLDVWQSFVFTHLGSPGKPFAEQFDPIGTMTKRFGLEKMRWAGRREYRLECNWKVFVDNYLDGGYHVNAVHPSLAGVLDYSGYRTEMFEWCNVQISPMRAPDPKRDDASAAEVRSGDEAQYWWLFPNLMINCYDGVMDSNLVLPTGPERCVVLFDFFFAEGTPNDLIAESIAVSDRIQHEDVDICERVQRGLCSTAFTTGRYSVRRESGTWHFHQLLARALRRALAAADS